MPSKQFCILASAWENFLKLFVVALDAIFCVLKIKSKLIYVLTPFYNKINIESL